MTKDIISFLYSDSRAVIYLILVLAAISILITTAIKDYQRTKSRIKNTPISANQSVSIQVWQVAYQQSAEGIRDLTKILSSTNFVGLTGCFTILATNNSLAINKHFLTIAIITFGIGLIVSVLPISSMSEQFRDDLSAIMESIAKGPDHDLVLPHTWPQRGRFFSFVIPLILLGCGVAALLIALTDA